MSHNRRRSTPAERPVVRLDSPRARVRNHVVVGNPEYGHVALNAHVCKRGTGTWGTPPPMDKAPPTLDQGTPSCDVAPVSKAYPDHGVPVNKATAMVMTVNQHASNTAWTTSRMSFRFMACPY